MKYRVIEVSEGGEVRFRAERKTSGWWGWEKVSISRGSVEEAEEDAMRDAKWRAKRWYPKVVAEITLGRAVMKELAREED